MRPTCQSLGFRISENWAAFRSPEALLVRWILCRCSLFIGMQQKKMQLFVWFMKLRWIWSRWTWDVYEKDADYSCRGFFVLQMFFRRWSCRRRMLFTYHVVWVSISSLLCQVSCRFPNDDTSSQIENVMKDEFNSSSRLRRSEGNIIHNMLSWVVSRHVHVLEMSCFSLLKLVSWEYDFNHCVIPCLVQDYFGRCLGLSWFEPGTQLFNWTNWTPTRPL